MTSRPLHTNSRRRLGATSLLLLLAAITSTSCRPGASPSTSAGSSRTGVDSTSTLLRESLAVATSESAPGRALADARALTAAPALPSPGAEPSPNTPIRFRDARAGSGIDFVHASGNSPEKLFPTANGSGVALLDYDGDGRLDIYFATTRELPLSAPTQSRGNRLYRNLGEGRFEDVTEKAGVGFRGFTHGVAAGDVDNNGFPDLYLANLGPDALYLNKGDGTFRDATAGSGVDESLWSSAAAMLDYDRDGKLDIYVTTYGKWRYEDEHSYCGDQKRSLRMYCPPASITPERHVLLKGHGDGTFSDVTEAAGVLRRDGRGMGVVAADVNRDGLIDLFVANDGCPNFLFINRGDGTFEDATENSGASATEAGYFQANMGVDAEDVNGDGLPELFDTTYRGEYNALYRNLDGRNFQEVSAWAGITKDSMPDVGWGCGLADLDGDGWPDMLVVNGHVDDNLVEIGRDKTPYAEQAKVWRNQGDGRYRLVADPGPFFATPHVARGAAFGDLDNDGDLDVVVSLMNEHPALLLNESPPHAWVGFQVVGTRSNRTAIGTVVTVHVGGRAIVRQLKGGGSYLCSNDPRIVVGLGTATRVDRVDIAWPGGARSRLEKPEPGQYHVVHEPAAAGGDDNARGGSSEAAAP